MMLLLKVRTERKSIITTVAKPCGQFCFSSNCSYVVAIVFRLLKESSEGKRFFAVFTIQRLNGMTVELLDGTTNFLEICKARDNCIQCSNILIEDFIQCPSLPTRPRKGSGINEIPFSCHLLLLFGHGCIAKKRRRNASLYNFCMLLLSAGDRQRAGSPLGLFLSYLLMLTQCLLSNFLSAAS